MGGCVSPGVRKQSGLNSQALPKPEKNTQNIGRKDCRQNLNFK